MHLNPQAINPFQHNWGFYSESKCTSNIFLYKLNSWIMILMFIATLGSSWRPNWRVGVTCDIKITYSTIRLTNKIRFSFKDVLSWFNLRLKTRVWTFELWYPLWLVFFYLSFCIKHCIFLWYWRDHVLYRVSQKKVFPSLRLFFSFNSWERPFMFSIFEILIEFSVRKCPRFYLLG